jgi:hypothetical protein
MKPCDERWHQDLLEHALGSPASGVLNEHLATCAACSAVLRELRAHAEQIDTGVQRLVAAEPSPHAVPRLMAHVRADRPPPWLRGREWRTAAVCALVIVSVALTYEWRASEQRGEAMQVLSAASAIGHWHSPTDGLLRFPMDRSLSSPPQLGKYFYQLNSRAPEKENKNP